jgi:fatty-acyl-CoA synthase
MFHSNALFVGFGPTIVAGGTAVLRRRFSASNALPDIRKYGCNFMNYVGKPLSYILAQPERPDDADNPLRLAYGNEAADLDIERFAASTPTF